MQLPRHSASRSPRACTASGLNPGPTQDLPRPAQRLGSSPMQRRRFSIACIRAPIDLTARRHAPLGPAPTRDARSAHQIPDRPATLRHTERDECQRITHVRSLRSSSSTTAAARHRRAATMRSRSFVSSPSRSPRRCVRCKGLWTRAHRTTPTPTPHLSSLNLRNTHSPTVSRWPCDRPLEQRAAAA